MKLQKLLTNITPLPWLIVVAEDGEKWVGTPEGDQRIATLDGNTQPIDHDYLVHAANVLPELVAAAKQLQESWEKNLSLSMASIAEVLARAEKVTLEPKAIRPPVQLATITPRQAEAVRRFIRCWDLSMPYHDIGPSLNCGECNALHSLLETFGSHDAAAALLDAHVSTDDEGDDPEHFQLRQSLERQQSSERTSPSSGQ